MKFDFDPNIAKDVWVEEAIMFSNIKWRCKKNKANKKHFYEWKYRTYNSKKAFSELFEFWSEKQIVRILKNLVNKKYLILGNFNKLAYDKTSWYAIWPNGQIDSTKRSDRDDQMGKPIPDNKTQIINTNNKEKNKKENSSSSDNESPKKYSSDFEEIWKSFPHITGRSKKPDAYKAFLSNKIDKELLIREIQLLNIKITLGIQDNQFIKWMHLWIRDFTPTNDIILEQDLRKIVWEIIKLKWDTRTNFFKILYELFWKPRIKTIFDSVKPNSDLFFKFKK